MLPKQSCIAKDQNGEPGNSVSGSASSSAYDGAYSNACGSADGDACSKTGECGWEFLAELHGAVHRAVPVTTHTHTNICIL